MWNAPISICAYRKEYVNSKYTESHWNTKYIQNFYVPYLEILSNNLFIFLPKLYFSNSLNCKVFIVIQLVLRWDAVNLMQNLYPFNT